MEIEDYQDYLIFEDGRVYSKKNKKYLKNSPHNAGYLKVTLYKDGNKETFLIHRLIGLHYIENPHNYPCIDHIDRNRKNNSISNLRWVNQSMNEQNKDVQKNNQLQIKNICYSNRYKKYRFQKRINGKKHEKYFKNLEEAIQYKEEYLQRNNNAVPAN
jgi:hypothetical protein